MNLVLWPSILIRSILSTFRKWMQIYHSIRKTVNNISSTFYFPWYTMFCIWDKWKSLRIFHKCMVWGKGGGTLFDEFISEKSDYFKEICFDRFSFNQYNLEEFTETTFFWNKYFFWRIETFDIMSHSPLQGKGLAGSCCSSSNHPDTVTPSLRASLLHFQSFCKITYLFSMYWMPLV